jgi:ribosomal protein S18 acetylase RimI-like enzyme
VTIVLREARPADRVWIRETLRRAFGSTTVVSRGRLWRADALSGFIAERESQRSGLLMYHADGRECEVVALVSTVARRGVGSALLDAAEARARDLGCLRIWLVTTNDNEAAIRFYKKRGWAIAAVHAGAVADARKLKPEIPLVSGNGTPIEDEIEFERALQSAAPG